MTRKGRAWTVALAILGVWWIVWFILGDDGNDAGKAGNATTSEETNSSRSDETEAVASTSVDASQDGAGDEQHLDRGNFVGTVRLVGPAGEPVGGVVELIEVDEDFMTHFATVARIGKALYAESIVQEAKVSAADGILSITADGNRADFIIVLAPGYSPFLAEWNSVTGDREYELTPALPIEVSVLTEDGAPIKDAQVWSRWTGTFDQNESAPLIDRFRPRFYQGVDTTDEDGHVTLTSTFPGWSTELFVRPGDLWATVVRTAESGQSIEILCPDGFMVTGKVTVNGKPPTKEVQLKATVHQGDQYWMLESGRVKEDGEYHITGIPWGYHAYQVEALGAGLANQTAEIFMPPVGGVVQLDFAMQAGWGGKLLLKDPWGEPIADGRIKFVAEGQRSHMYGYNTAEDGLVEFPPAFTHGDPWWLNLRLGDDLYVRLDEPFTPDEEMEITVTNLARIRELIIPDDLLKSASISDVTWKGLSSQSWGTAAWSSETAADTLLASGNASLDIALSDGRRFSQPIVLAPGFDGPIDVDLQPATLRFELPNDPPAYVGLTNQDGVAVFEQDGVTGEVSIPIWMGNFSLLVMWPETAREFPLVRIEQPELHLGKIEAAGAGFIEGLVSDADGNPVQWADVYLTSSSGFSSQFSRTGTDGVFVFFDVPLGKYYLLCDTSANLGSHQTTVVQDLVITPDRLNQQVFIEVPFGKNGAVKLSCGGEWAFNSHAILSTATQSSSASLHGDGTASLSALPVSGWLGVAQVLDGQVRAQAMAVAAGPGDYTMPAAADRTTRIHFVDEYGQSWKHLVIRLELRQHPVTKRPTLNDDGSLTAITNPEAPWSLLVCDLSGQTHRFELAAMGADQQLVIPRNVSGRSMVIMNEEGSPIPWATLQSPSKSSVFPADHAGEAIVPGDFDGDLIAAAPGYLACWVNPSADSIVLPQQIDGVQVQLPTGTTNLSWTHDSGFISIWPSGLDLNQSQKMVTLPPLHAAAYSFSALAKDGQVLATSKAKIAQNDQVVALK